MMKPFRILGKGVQDVWLNKHGSIYTRTEK